MMLTKCPDFIEILQIAEFKGYTPFGYEDDHMELHRIIKWLRSEHHIRFKEIHPSPSQDTTFRIHINDHEPTNLVFGEDSYTKALFICTYEALYSMI